MPGGGLSNREAADPARPRSRRQPVPMRVWLAALPAAGPVGLVVYILAGISLPLAAFFIAVIGATGWALIASRSKPAAHELARRAADGAIAGAIATVAYDAARYGLVSLVQMSFSPFHVWQLFGQLFLGEDANPTAAYVVGVAYHLGNGIGLGAAYRLVVSRPTVVNGIVWAMALEFTMALLYPSWLRMTALGEFLEVSVLGHAVYGIVLARLCQRAIARRQRVAATAAAPGGPDLGSSPGAPS